MSPRDNMDAVEKRKPLPLQGIEPQLCGLQAGSLVIISTEPQFLYVTEVVVLTLVPWADVVSTSLHRWRVCARKCGHLNIKDVTQFTVLTEKEGNEIKAGKDGMR